MVRRDFTHIAELRKLLDEKERLLQKEAELSASMLTDFHLIPVLYDWYKEIQTRRRHPVAEREVIFKKQFTYLIVSFYTPVALAGGIMRRGVREKLSCLFGFKSSSYVSNLCSDAISEYATYKDFRRDVLAIYQLLLERLQQGGFI